MIPYAEAGVIDYIGVAVSEREMRCGMRSRRTTAANNGDRTATQSRCQLSPKSYKRSHEDKMQVENTTMCAVKVRVPGASTPATGKLRRRAELRKNMREMS